MEKGQLVQANRYITWVKQNPDSFELLVRKNISDFKGEIDFVNPRVICFAQDFTIDDKCLALSLDAELWKYRYYQNDMLFITREEEPEQLVKTKGNKTYTIKTIEKEPKPRKTVDELIAGATKELTDTFEQFNNKVLEISSEIERYNTNAEIVYKTSFNIAYVAVQKKNNYLRIYLRTLDDKMNDPKKLTEKVPRHFGYGNITRKVLISPNELSRKFSWDDIMELVFQSYNTTQ